MKDILSKYLFFRYFRLQCYFVLAFLQFVQMIQQYLQNFCISNSKEHNYNENVFKIFVINIIGDIVCI